MVRRWCRQFTAGRQHVHDEERSGRSSINTDDLVELVRERFMENRRFTGTQQLFPADFLLLVAQNCYGVPVVQKILRKVGAKAIDIEYKAKRMESAFTVFSGV